MAKKKFEEEMRQAYDKYMADTDKMDQFIMANAHEMAMAEKVSKEMTGVIVNGVTQYHLGPNDIIFTLAKTTAQIIEAIASLGEDGDELTEKYKAILGLCRTIAKKERQEMDHGD